MLKPRPILLLR